MELQHLLQVTLHTSGHVSGSLGSNLLGSSATSTPDHRFYSWRLVLLYFKCSNVFLPSWKPFRIRHIKFPTLEKNFKTLFIWKLLSKIYFLQARKMDFLVNF